jgi:hypothetical protein
VARYVVRVILPQSRLIDKEAPAHLNGFQAFNVVLDP